MPRVSDLIRRHLESQAFPKTLPPLESLRETEWSQRFETLMRNRLLMGAFRYGLLEVKRHQRWDFLGSLERRIEQYKQTGSQEHLVDAANLLMLEFEFPQQANAHWLSIDDGEHVTQL